MGYTPTDSATILIAGNVPETVALGIDFLFFGYSQSSNQLRGIKLIPKGIHLIHITDVVSNTRRGRFVYLRNGDLLVISLDAENGNAFQIDYIVDKDGHPVSGINTVIEQDGATSIDYSRHLNSLPANYPYMVNFMKYKNEGEISHESWERLVRSLSIQTISKITEGTSKSWDLESQATSLISTEDSTQHEVEELEKFINNSSSRNEHLKQKFSQLHTESLKQLNFTVIDFKRTVRPGATIEQITKDYLDKTWIVLEKYGKDSPSLIESVITELKVSYLLGFILNNYSCFQAWGLILKILLNCQDLFLDSNHNEFLFQFLDTLKLQLTCLSPNLVKDEDNDEVIFKLSSLSSDFKTFLRTINDNGNVELGLLNSSIFNLLNDKFEIQITASLDSDDEDYDDDFFRSETKEAQEENYIDN